MRNSKDIYIDAEDIVMSSGNQSLKSMALVGINLAKKEMFEFLYEQAQCNKNLTLEEFFNKMDQDLTFEDYQRGDWVYLGRGNQIG